MTRAEAIAVIADTLPSLDDSSVASVADMVKSMAASGQPVRLTAAERAALERSRQDFTSGRVLDEQQYEVEMSEFFVRLASSQASR